MPKGLEVCQRHQLLSAAGSPPHPTALFMPERLVCPVAIEVVSAVHVELPSQHMEGPHMLEVLSIAGKLACIAYI